MSIGWFSRSSKQQPSSARVQCIAVGFGVAILLLTVGIAVAQTPAGQAPAPESTMSIPAGYSVHASVDAGGRYSDQVGSGSMYDTMVNLQSGPRILGQTFEMRALPGNKHPLFDELSAFSNGFGGEPYNYSKLSFSKGKYYEFSGMFRRNRRYFDYDLMGNPGIPTGYSIPIGPSTAPTGFYAWPQINDSPFMFNDVRHMTDVNLTLLPLSKVTFRFAYSQNLFEGPSITPSGNSVAGSEVLLEEYQRNSTDNFMGAVDWKPVAGTKLTYEQQVDHYKGNSFFTMAPGYLNVLEPDGTKVSLLSSYQNFVPYGYSGTGAFSPSGVCNTSSMINSSTILSANPNGGLPIIDPACNVITSYFRSQPTREIFPSEIFRLQSTSLKNVSMNGDVRYTKANMNLPNYYDTFQGLNKALRANAYTAFANTKREVLAVDYGIVWQASKTVSLEDQVVYSNERQPGGVAEFTSGTTVTVPTTAGAETINNPALTSTTVNTGGAPFDFPSAIGTPTYNYFAQKFTTNNATVSWDATPRATFALTYRYQKHEITEGSPNSTSATTGAELFTINENGGILNVALRPTNNWNINGSVEMLFNDNVFTPMGARQTRQYRVHTLYRPKTWATLSAAYNDLERNNNTNNTGTTSFASDGTTPLNLEHVDHSRALALSAELFPNEHYGLDLNYGYTDVYMAENICFEGAATAMPGGTVAPGPATPSGGLCYPVARGFGSQAVVFGPAKDFEDAPTQYGSASILLAPNPKFHTNIGYRATATNGSRFFTDTSDVNGALVSTYQTPFLSVAWTVHPGLVWKGEYDYYSYTEGGGQSGAQWCNTNTPLTVGNPGPLPVVACSSIPNTAMSPATPMYGFTAPRDFHANNLTLGVHYEF